jgi:2,4-didehydro-3-deoxy-L-rhamnonate hydrolase
MRLVSFGPPGNERAGALLPDDTLVPLDELGIDGAVIDLLADGRLGEVAARTSAHRGAGIPLGTVRLGAPVPRPGQVICIGLNYRDHAGEQGKPAPAAPLLFAKSPGAVAGPRDPIPVPGADCLPDYEVELAVVIGRTARAVATSDALAHVGGWMVANDVSARRWQADDGQWFRAKSSDGFLPCGPWLTTAEDVADHRSLRLTTTIAGTVLQDAPVSDLIHDVPALIAWISRTITLRPGDIICTGTPGGVGAARSPKRFLQPGETVVCAITGLGSLANPVVLR